MDRLGAKMARRRPGVHHAQIRKRNRRPSREADLERGRPFGLKRRRTSITRRGGRASYHYSGTRGSRIVSGANGRVVANRGVGHADMVRVRGSGCRVRRIHRGCIGSPVIARLHRQVRRKIGGAGSLYVQGPFTAHLVWTAGHRGRRIVVNHAPFGRTWTRFPAGNDRTQRSLADGSGDRRGASVNEPPRRF